MRTFKETRETTNSRVYQLLERNYKIKCVYCSPNQGCNYTSKRHPDNWKEYRKTQWK